MEGTAITKLELYNRSGLIRLNDNENKQMASLLKKNYALERLPDISAVGDVGAILQLNAAGRRYLIEDGSSISKGVDVLSRVNNDIHCVFLHLLENPRLCDRSAVEIVCSTGESNSNPTVSSGGGGKGSKPVYTKAANPAGGSRSFDPTCPDAR
jgi:hypothetical protein